MLKRQKSTELTFNITNNNNDDDDDNITSALFFKLSALLFLQFACSS